MKRVFIRGLAFILPITLTVYLFYWLFIKTEAMADYAAKEFGLSFLNFPGSGIVFILLIIMGIGALSLSSFFDKLMSHILKTIEKIPIVNSIFGPLRDLMRFLGEDADQAGRKVVLVEYKDIYCLGLVTNTAEALKKDEYKDLVAVYIPMSYNVGGYTILVPKDKLVEVNIEVEQAIKLAITGWINKE